MAKVLAYAEATGPDPKSFILKPEEAISNTISIVRAELANPDFSWKDIGHIEINEAFDVGNILVMKFHPEITREKMNKRGGAIAHGHAIGASGVPLTVKSIDISLTDQIKYHVVSLCHAVDSASALFLENPNV